MLFLFVCVAHFFAGSYHPDIAFFEPYDSVAQLAYLFDGVGDEDDGGLTAHELLYPLLALFLELIVAYGKDLIADKDLRFDHGRYRKTQTRLHTG